MTLVRIALLIGFCCIVSIPVVGAAHAQSLTTASKTAEISVFGGYLGGTPDYGSRALKGVSAGADFTVFPRFLLKPSLEVRGNDLIGTDATEKTILFGPRAQLDLRDKFHPYGDFLIGVGNITFHPAPEPNYTGDRSKVYSYGGGINIDVSHHFAAKFDFQQQSWNLGPYDITVPNSGNFTLAPRTITIGITYTLPFRFLKTSADYR